MSGTEAASGGVRDLMERIEALLSGGPWKGRNPRKGFSTSQHLSMGRSVNALGAAGFEGKHTWRPGKGLYMRDIHDRYPAGTFRGKLWRLAHQLLLRADPWYAQDQDYVLQVSKMHAGDAVPKHTDSQDASYQLAFTLGDFTGGRLRIYAEQQVDSVDGDTPARLYDNRYRVLKFDGRYVHDVTPVESGTRYCVIFYKTWDRRLRGPQPLVQEPEVVAE